MYSDIEASFNSLLMPETSAKLDLKLFLFTLLFALCFAGLDFKKASVCFLSRDHAHVLLETKYTPH